MASTVGHSLDVDWLLHSKKGELHCVSARLLIPIVVLTKNRAASDFGRQQQEKGRRAIAISASDQIDRTNSAVYTIRSQAAQEGAKRRRLYSYIPETRVDTEWHKWSSTDECAKAWRRTGSAQEPAECPTYAHKRTKCRGQEELERQYAQWQKGWQAQLMDIEYQLEIFLVDLSYTFAPVEHGRQIRSQQTRCAITTAQPKARDVESF